MSVKVKLTEKQKKANKAEYDRAYYIKNKAKLAVYHKNRYQEQKFSNGIVVVYQIPNYDGKGNIYAGVTQNIINRKHKHKHLGKLNVDKTIIIAVCKTREKARFIEDLLHQLGCHGAYQRDDCKLTRELERPFKLTLNN